MSKAKLARIVFKKLKEGIPGGPAKGQKVKSHAIYAGKRFELDELVPVQVRGEKNKPIKGFEPRVVQQKRLAALEAKPTVRQKIKSTSPNQARNIKIMDELNAMSDKELFRLTTKEMKDRFGRDLTATRKRILDKRINPETGKTYQPFKMGLSAFGRRYKQYDEFDNPIAIDRKLKSDLGLKEKNYKKIIKLFNDIDSLAESKTMSGINARSSLFLQVNRAIQGGKAAKIPEDQVVQNVIKQVDNSAWGNMLKERNVRAADIKRGEKIGILTKDDRPEISHVIPVKNDLSKALDIQNVFYEPRGINRARPRGEIAQRRDDYLQELDSRIINYDLMDKYSLSKGGLIKKGLQKIIDSAKFDPSRRKFMKQTGAAAASAAMPVGRLAPLAAQVATKTITRKAPPWIKSMVGVLDQLSGPNAMGRTLSNGTMIRNFGSKGNKQSFEITNSDGYKVPVNMTKEKNGNLDIEFDIRSDFANNQHIYIDKKTGQVEIVDENYYMTSPEDYAKDDPIIWDVTTPSQMQAFERKMGVMRGDGSEKMKDFASLPEDGDYSELFESFIDSFSPSGNIFNTKAKAKQIAKEQKRLKNLRDERMEMDFESQFRGGNIHGFNRGGIQIERKDKPDRPPQPRFDFIRNISDREAMARMMMAEDDKNFEGGKAVGHVIYNRSINPDGRSRYGAYENMDSDIRAIISAPNQFTPFSDRNTRFFADYKDQDLSLYNQYLDYADQIIAGQAKDFTGGADFFLTPEAEKKYEGNLFGLSQQPQYIDQYGGHKFYKSYNQGGMANKFTVSDAVKEIKANPQNFVGGGLVKKLAPKVIGKLREYSPKLTGPKVQGPMRPDRPFTVFDEAGLPIKDFDTEKAARNFLRKDPSANTYKVGARKPQVDDTAGAMFWSSREKLIDAPMESAKGAEWLAYLKRPFAKHNPIKDMELNDTQLSTHLSRNGSKTLSKAQIIEEFDTKLAPEIDVISLGSPGVKESKALTKLYRKTDLQAYRPGPLKNVLSGMKMRIPSLEEAVNNNNKDVILKEVATIEDLVQKNFGVANSITEGFPQKFPYELKQPLQEIASTTGIRLGGFKEYAKEATYRGQQTMGGGSNYREFLFKYNHKPGSLRNTEPTYTYAHDFGLGTSQRANAFVHMRTSDRTDEFGRRILHIEEIQSDMHQPINAASRRVKKAQAAGQTNQSAYQNDLRNSKYADRGDLVRETDNANEQQMMLIQSKIEDLLSMPQTKQTQVRLARLNRERAKIRNIIAEKRAAAGSGDNSGIPQGPYSKTEDYNEFVMKYALKTAQEGGYDGISISTPAIKNRSTSVGSRDYIGNITAYGPIAEGAMKKVSKKSGAKFMKSVIVDDDNRAYEVPMLLIKDNQQAIDRISKGLGAYKRGGIAING
jgi:hypothetical protein